MAVADAMLDQFINEVCGYMRTWNSYANAIDGHISLDSVCSEPYADFKKKLKLFYRAFDPLHREWLNQFFTKAPFDRPTVMLLLSCHCFKLQSKSKNIFMCLLYICSYTYSLLHYCEKNKMDGMLIQLRTILMDNFPVMQARFIMDGGWIGLNKFCSSKNLHVLLQFINHGYCEKAIFHTFVYRDRCFDFGLHGRETLDLLMNNVLAFESSVREAFNREINSDPNYKEEVEIAFAKLRMNLQHGPFQNFLSIDKDSIAVNPTAPLSQV